MRFPNTSAEEVTAERIMWLCVIAGTGHAPGQCPDA